MTLTLAELLHDAVPYALPLTRRFRGIDERQGMLIRGPSGWGEFAPFDDYTPAAAAHWLAAAAEAAFGTWPESRRSWIHVNAIVPAVGADDAAALARTAVLQYGCTTLKIKVGAPGQNLADDEARVASVRDAADSALRSLEIPGPAELRLDANAAWSLDDAIRSLTRLSAYGLEYVEQPCAGLQDLAMLRRRIDVPIAVDETIRVDRADVSTLAEVADVVIVKAAPVGGVWAALDLLGSWSGRVVVSGALDSAVGLSAGLALAAALPEAPGACGLGTGMLLADDVTTQPRVPSRGVMAVERVNPDLDALMRARTLLGDDRARQWRERAAEAWEAGGADLIARAVERT